VAKLELASSVAGPSLNVTLIEYAPVLVPPVLPAPVAAL
jgi:hypothetical protein